MSAGEKEVRELFGLDDSGAGAKAKADIATPDVQANPSSVSSTSSASPSEPSGGGYTSSTSQGPAEKIGADGAASQGQWQAADTSHAQPGASSHQAQAAEVGRGSQVQAAQNGQAGGHQAGSGHAMEASGAQMRSPGAGDHMAASKSQQGGVQAAGPKASDDATATSQLGTQPGAHGQGAPGGASQPSGASQPGGASGHPTGASQPGGHGQVGAAASGGAVAQHQGAGAGAGSGAGGAAQGGVGQGVGPSANGGQVGHAGQGAAGQGIGHAHGGAQAQGVGPSGGSAGQANGQGLGQAASQGQVGQGNGQSAGQGVGQSGPGQVGQANGRGVGPSASGGQVGPANGQGAGQGSVGQANGQGVGQGSVGQANGQGAGQGSVGQANGQGAGQGSVGQGNGQGVGQAHGAGAGASGVGQAGGNVGSAAGQGAGVSAAQGANEGGVAGAGVSQVGGSGATATPGSGVGAAPGSVSSGGPSMGSVSSTPGATSSGVGMAPGGANGGVGAAPGGANGGIGAAPGGANDVPGGVPGGQTPFSGDPGGSSVPGGVGSGGSSIPGQAGSPGSGLGAVPTTPASPVATAAEEATKKSLFDELITRFPPKEVIKIIQEKDAKGLRQLLVNQLPENFRPELINDLLDMADDHFAKKAEQALKRAQEAKAAVDADLIEALLHDDLKLTVASGDKLDVREFSVREALSTTFEVRLYALSKNADVKFDDVIGKEASFELRCDKFDDSKNRYWRGICSKIEQVGVDTENLSGYEVVLVPTLWKLSQRKNYRVFQYLSEPAIVKQLLDEWKIETEWRVDWGQYKARKFRVQYDESDLAFISRNLEDAGITYFFEQIDDKTVMVLEDQPHLTKKREPAIDYQNRAMKVTDQEFVTDVQMGSRTRPGKYTIFDHDYRRAGDFILSASTAGGLADEANLERFHYIPGAFLFVTEGGDTPNADDRGVARHDQGEADKLAKRRFEAKRSAADSLTFQTNVHALRPGVVMEIANHARADLQGTPLLVAAAKLDGALEGGWRHVCEVRNAKLPYRPALVTPKPRVIGPESATVVGPPGEEIHTDEFARVRVQFHWDREGKRDASSSCWIHVNQPWAGTGFGGVNIPRVGQEVIVDFLSGDPDRPIIMGRYFTNTTKVPWTLPANKTQGGFKSMSSPGGGGYNELMFEDKKGSELVRFQAEKDFSGLVKNNYALNIQNSRRINTKIDDTESVGQNQTIQVGKDRNVKVKQHQIHQVTKEVKLHSVTGSVALQAQESVLIQSLMPKSIQLICGQSSITLEPAQITIESPMVQINPGATIPVPPAPDILADLAAAPAGHFFGSP